MLRERKTIINFTMLFGTIASTTPFIYGFINDFSEKPGSFFSQEFCDALLILGNIAVLVIAILTRKDKKSVFGIMAITLSLLALIFRLALRIWGFFAFGI